MYPTRVPTYSTEIGTSRSTTGSTFTTGAGGAAVARDASPHPATVITTSPISETTSSPRMSIMRLLLSSGAEGKPIRMQRSPHPRQCARRLLVPCGQRHAEDTPQGEQDGGRTRSAHEESIPYFFAQRASACWSALIA